MVPWAVNTPTDTSMIVLYLCFCIGFGGLVRCLLKHITIGDFRFPYSAALLLLGVVFGLITLKSNTLVDISTFIIKLNPFDLIAMFIVPFMFKTAFQMDMHIFLKSLSQILTISTMGFCFSFIVIGFFTSYITEKEWPVVSAILFGLIASMIDTKDTNKLLGQIKNLGILLAGEELITSSISLFLYDTLVHLQYGPLKTDSVFISLLKIGITIVAGLAIGKLFVCFLSWDRCDFYTSITISLFVTYGMLYSVEFFVGASGILSVIVFGIFISCTKRQMAADIEHSLVQFWQLLYNIFNFVLYIEVGVLLVHSSRSSGERSDVVRIVITYIMCLITRSIMLLIFSPILTRFGYGLDWKNGVVLVWGALKGTGTLLLATCVYIDPSLFGDFSHKALIYAVGLVLMQFIINGSTIKKTVRFLGFTTVSALKISNMNNIILYVMSSRDKAINMLKMNRLFVDAAWDIVRIATKIVHPYKDSFTEEGAVNEGEDKVFIYPKCPDCHKEIPLQYTPKELQEMKKDAYLRILKAKKVSYWRQFECGMITKDANRTLVATVDNALEKNMGLIDVDSLKNIWKPRGCSVRVRNTLVKFMPKEDPNLQLKIPPKRWQLCLHKVVSSIWWEYGIFLLVLLGIISIILDFIYRPVSDHGSECVLLVISTLFFMLLLLQTFLKALAVGCCNFMRSAWHFIDMSTIAVTSCYFFYVYKYYLVLDSEQVTDTIIKSLSASRVIFALRFLRICHVIRASIPKIVQHLDRKIDVQLAHGYDVGKGFVTGENDVLKLLPRFIADKKILSEIKLKIEADRLAITKEIGLLQRNRPALAITVKTREAMAMVLHVMKETTKELKDGGLVDYEEHQLMCRAIDERQKYIRKHYLSISPSAPDILLRQVSWLIDDEETANFLIDHSLMVNLNYEEILIRADDEPQGIYVLVSGIVRMMYIPNIKKLDKLERCGALPNVDYPTSVNFREKQEDYIVSGNVIGEIGILSGRTYDATITCDSSVQAFFISVDVINYVIKSQTYSFTGLEQRLWKAVSIRLACIILPAVPTYQYWTQERIQIHLERAFVPKLNPKKTFIMSEVMEVVLLIEGRALDIINKDIYFAPSYIPRTVRKLSFLSNITGIEYQVQPILLVLPAEDIDEQELMDFLEEDSDLTSVDSFSTLRRKLKPTLNPQTRGLSNKTMKRNMLGLNKVDGYGGGVRTMKAGSDGETEGQPSAQQLTREETHWHELDRREKEEKEAEDDDDDEEEENERSDDEDAEVQEDVIVDNMSKSFDYKVLTHFEGTKKVLLKEGSSKPPSSLKVKMEKDGGSYSLSYFNYKPLYDMNLEGNVAETRSTSVLQPDVEGSAVEEQVESNVLPEKSGGGPQSEPRSVMLLDTENGTDDFDANEGTSKPDRAPKKRWFF